MKTAQEFKNEGNQAFKAKDFNKAIKQYGKAIELDPKNAAFYSNRANAYINIGDLEKALEDSENCIKTDENFVKGYVRKASVLLKMQKLPELKTHCEKAIKKFPENALLKNFLKQSSQTPQFDLQSLLQNPMVQQMIQKNPQLAQQIIQNPQLLQNPQMMQMMMNMFQQQQQNPNSTPNTNPTQESQNQFNPQQSQPQFNQQTDPTQTPNTPAPKKEGLNSNEFEKIKKDAGQLYMKKQFDEAIVKYQKCIALNPENLIVRNNLAACQIELKNLEEALKIIQEAIKVYQESEFENRNYEHYAKVIARKARIYHIKQDYDTAISLYEDSLLENNDRKVRNILREVKKEKKKIEEQAYIDPVKSEEHRQKGNEFFKAHKFPEAIKEYEEAQKRNPKDLKVTNNIAATLMKLLRFNEALEAVDKVLKVEPENIKALIRKGSIYQFRKEFHKAIETYQKVLKIDPKNSQAEQGLQATQLKISGQMNNQNDEERVKRAMSDPQIQQIMMDPMMRIALEQMKTNPQAAMEYFKDPNLAPKLQKLIQAGILRMG